MATETLEKVETSKPLLAENGLGISGFLKSAGEEKANETAPVAVAEIPADTKGADPKAKPDAADRPVGDEKPAKTVADPAPKGDEKELAKLQKQLKDTRDAFTQERQTNKTMLTKVGSLEKSIEILTKKIDGTYDEQKDAPRVPTTQEMLNEAHMQGLVKASHFAAIELLMERDHLTREEADSKIKTLVWAEDAPFRAFDNDEMARARIMNSPIPAIEALKILKESEDRKTYGDTPEAMRKALTKELEITIEKKVRDKLLKELKGKGIPFEELKGLGGVPSVSPERAPQADARPTLESLFPNFKGAA